MGGVESGVGGRDGERLAPASPQSKSLRSYSAFRAYFNAGPALTARLPFLYHFFQHRV